MQGLSVAANKIYKDNSRKGWSYHLIILNSLRRTLQIKPYDRDSLDQALADYARYEAEAANGAKIEPVLVSAGPMMKLRRAFPNFFLDINEFVKRVKKICTDAK
jgi:putative GTP pyrophosphokinase